MALISTPVLVLLIVLAVLLVAVVVLYIIASKAQKKSDEQRELMEGQSQIMSFYVIDKARVKLSEAGFPKIVLEQTPKYLRRSKVPILKVKVGQRVMTLMADQEVYNTILPKQEVKAKQLTPQQVTQQKLREQETKPKDKISPPLRMAMLFCWIYCVILPDRVAPRTSRQAHRTAMITNTTSISSSE